MSKKSKILVSLLVLVLAAGAIGYFSLFGKDAQPGPEASPGTVSQEPSFAPVQPGPSATTATASPGTSSPSPASDLKADPRSAVAGLVEARFNNDESRARQYGSEAAVRQIYSFPPFNIREATVSCSEQGNKATCSVSSPAAGGSMIMALSRTTTSWRVEQIEPVID
ncbi:MAG: hypothetical protein DCC49_00820 [Acidobacteria bacterium]|nr:MAG: hypothetical protein DCC49_00820 [Acidobacteriota bacterium]